MLFIRRAPIFVVVACLGFIFHTGYSFARSVDRVSDSYSHYSMGLLFDELGQFKEASEEYTKALRSDPSSIGTHLKLALDYIRLAQDDDAIRHLKSVGKIDAQNIESRLILALLYTSLGRYDEAKVEYEVVLKKASELDPKNLDIYYSLAQLYYEQKKLDLAVDACKAIIRLAPNEADAHYLLGFIYDDNARHKEAIAEFNKALQLKPDSADFLNSLAYAYAEAGINLNEAEILIKKALRSDPKNGAYIDTLGWIYFKKGLLDDAIAKLEEASGLLKEQDILNHLVEAYSKKGLIEKVNQTQKKIAELKAKKPIATCPLK